MTADQIVILWVLSDLFNLFVLFRILGHDDNITNSWLNPVLGPVATAILSYYIIVLSVNQSINIVIGRIYHDR